VCLVHGRTLLAAAALLLAVPFAAPAADDAGEAPVGLVWSFDEAARTPALITAGAPADQRVVYGVAGLATSARVVVRTLEAPGAETGAAAALTIDDIGADATAFGATGAVAPVAVPGRWALAVHNDNGRVEIARIDVAGATADGGRSEEEYVLPGSAGCQAEATPLVAAGALWLATEGAGCAALWRVSLGADAALGAAERLDVVGLDAATSPAQVVLGTRVHVTVAAGSSLVHVPADGALAPGPVTALPEGDLPRAALASPDAIHVAARTAAGATRIHRLRTGDGAVEASGPAFGGAPGPALALAGDDLLVTTSAGVHLVPSSSLVARSTAAAGAHGQTAPAARGSLAYLVSDAGRTEVLRLPSGTPLAGPDFDRAELGAAQGAPALARGYVVWSGAAAVAAHRSRDVTPPVVEWLGRGRALAGDARGIGRVEFRAARDGGVAEVVASATAPVGGDPFGDGAQYVAEVALPRRGTYLLDAVAIDTAGNRATSGRVTVRVGAPRFARGACANRIAGSAARDVLRGARAGDRLLGRAGRDLLEGRGGRDCLSAGPGADDLRGGAGADRLDGGGGDDRLTGGPGRDRIRCGPGHDRVRAAKGDRVAKDCELVRR
jgi:hypothetical protein